MRVVNALLVKDEKVLLLYKETRQKWFLPGGKSEFGESVIQTGCREFLEETGLDLQDAVLGAVTTIVLPERQEEWMLYTLKATKALGDWIAENREGILRWHSVAAVKTLPMFEGDRFIVDKLLDEKQQLPIVSAQLYTVSYELNKIMEGRFGG